MAAAKAAATDRVTMAAILATGDLVAAAAEAMVAAQKAAAAKAVAREVAVRAVVVSVEEMEAAAKAAAGTAAALAAGTAVVDWGLEEAKVGAAMAVGARVAAAWVAARVEEARVAVAKVVARVVAREAAAKAAAARAAARAAATAAARAVAREVVAMAVATVARVDCQHIPGKRKHVSLVWAQACCEVQGCVRIGPKHVRPCHEGVGIANRVGFHSALQEAGIVLATDHKATAAIPLPAPRTALKRSGERSGYDGHAHLWIHDARLAKLGVGGGIVLLACGALRLERRWWRLR